MEAVVYTSNTGSTEHYAKLLGDELRMPVYSEEEAKNICIRVPKLFILDGLWQEKYRGLVWQ